ncbi:sulfite oxidase [Streptomyces sp. NPDC052225]|uniref:sulfite oxidase n=1 Tax=Streptomyces sp. NPDC052225 TaxID=3154949 RepID=UPI00341D8562
MGPRNDITLDELALATRNHGLPLEALRYDVTPPGLHYILVHYDIPAARAEDWQLSVTGQVRTELSLSLDDLRSLPSVTHHVVMECAGNGRALLVPRPISQPWLVEAVGCAQWTGVPLRTVLEQAGVRPGAVEAVFTGADHGIERGVEQDYQRSLPLPLPADVLLAYAMNGRPLPPQHGFPLRLIVPGWYGMAHVKWLRGITLVDTPFTGYQQAVAYRYRDRPDDPDDPGRPVTRIAPRALLVPPGFPDFMTRARTLRPGPTTLHGRAWSGHGPIARVEVSTDHGHTWHDAHVTPRPADSHAWQAWHTSWNPTPGLYSITARATDTHGNTQPLDPPWNHGGFTNNSLHHTTVHCTPHT